MCKESSSKEVIYDFSVTTSETRTTTPCYDVRITSMLSALSLQDDEIEPQYPKLTFA